MNHYCASKFHTVCIIALQLLGMSNLQALLLMERMLCSCMLLGYHMCCDHNIIIPVNP